MIKCKSMVFIIRAFLVANFPNFKLHGFHCIKVTLDKKLKLGWSAS